jgi:hypothetical protein
MSLETKVKAEFGFLFSTEELGYTEDQANSSLVSCLEWMKMKEKCFL